MNNDWLDIAVLEDYLDGKLDAQAMHRVEREALEDPFVAEALEGLKATPKRKQTLSILQKQLHDRIKNKPIKRKLWGITTQRLSIAATATVAFIAVSILFIMRETNRRNQVASKDHKEVIVTLDSNLSTAKQEAVTKTTSADQAKPVEKKIEIVESPKLSQSSSSKLDEKKSAKGESSLNDEVASAISSASKISAAKTLQKTNEIRAIVATTANGIGVSERSNEVLTGKVVAKDDGLALPGVTVRLEGSNVSTTTDKNGDFTLVADSTKNNNLVASYIGFKSKTMIRNLAPTKAIESKPLDSANQAKNILAGNSGVANNPIKIALESDHSSLNDVVVTGFRRAAKKELTSASSTIILSTGSSPNSGWTKWREYLQKNNRIIKTGTKHKEVVLGFHVSNQGTPIYIKVIKGLGKKEDAEAIRLLKDGPLWKSVEEEVQVTIDF